VLVALAAAGVKQALDRHADYRWAQDEALPRIRALVEDEWRDYTEAYALAAQAEEVIPDDPELARIFERISLRMDIGSAPDGADVYMKRYSRPDDPWTNLGKTPLQGIRVPVGIFRWKFEKEGFVPVMATASSWDIALSKNDLLVP